VVMPSAARDRDPLMESSQEDLRCISGMQNGGVLRMRGMSSILRIHPERE